MSHFDHFPRPGEIDPYRSCRLIWCPVGYLVGGCGSRAVFRKTPIFTLFLDGIMMDIMIGNGDI